MKKIIKVLTNRITITALCIVFQFLIAFSLLVYFNGIFKYYLIVWYFVAVFCSVGVINTSMNSAYKITWIIVILGIPIVGVTMFLFLYGRLLTRLRRRRMLSITESLENELCKNSDIELPNNLKRQSNYITKYAHSAPVKNTTAKYIGSL